MGKNLAGKTGFIIAILVVFIYGIFGIPHGSIKQSITDRIHLGLDLKGGTHLVLKIRTQESLNSATDRDVQHLNTALTGTGATAIKLDPAHPDVVTVSGFQGTQASAVRDILNSNEYSSYDLSSSASGGYQLTMKHAAIDALNKSIQDQSIETMQERVDSLGVAEAKVEPYGLGESEILVEIPGVEDPARVEGIIMSTAKLEIHEVVGGPFQTEAEAMQGSGGVLPPDVVVLKGTAGNGGSDEYYSLKRASIVEGPDFRDAQPSTDENGRPDITFSLTTAAGDLFYKYTDANKGTGRMAIVLENRIREVASIEGGIRDQGRISGGGISKEYAQTLSLMLRTGSLPASIDILETRSVGASLGADSIRHGVIAAIAGMLAVMVFMLIYYRGAGINADLALFLNLVILLGFMGFTGSTLTLPGIAGVILTIGMGVDSNVLIFERIREELRLGKSAAAAVQDGFGTMTSGALMTIIDTHVTTIVSAGILFLFGTGPVKGFAVTLVFGLLANLFTAVFVSRTIFEYLLSKKDRNAALSI